jgi:hypothetical protein
MSSVATRADRHPEVFASQPRGTLGTVRSCSSAFLLNVGFIATVILTADRRRRSTWLGTENTRRKLVRGAGAPTRVREDPPIAVGERRSGTYDSRELFLSDGDVLVLGSSPFQQDRRILLPVAARRTIWSVKLPQNFLGGCLL